MTLIRIYLIDRITKNNCKRKKEIIELKCDECNKIYNSKSCSNSRLKKSKLHFCSKKCSAISFSKGKLRDESKKRLFEIYGSFFVQTKEFKEKSEESCLEKYGVISYILSDEYKENTKSTNLKKYGKETYAGSNNHQSKLDYKNIAKKAWITKIKNGTCSKSKPEEKLYILLINKFGENNVVRQFFILKQWVDFYIKNIDLYIQVDGVYWHGLNRDIKDIKKGKTSQDKKIYKQILRDKKLNQYMIDNNLNLVRITDEQLKVFSDEETYCYLENKMPTYLYICEPQNKEFEEMHSITTVLEKCPECEKNNLPEHKPKRLICSATPGTVELYGQDLIDKVKSDAKQLKKDMGKSEKQYSNMLGESKYQSVQQRIDKQRR